MKCEEFVKQRVENVIAVVSGSETKGIHKVIEMTLVSLIS
jgi:hypothetical protein